MIERPAYCKIATSLVVHRTLLFFDDFVDFGVAVVDTLGDARVGQKCLAVSVW